MRGPTRLAGAGPLDGRVGRHLALRLGCLTEMLATHATQAHGLRFFARKSQLLTTSDLCRFLPLGAIAFEGPHIAD